VSFGGWEKGEILGGYWVGDLFLNDTYSRLFSISECKESTMEELGVEEQENPMQVSRWNLVWRRARFEWEKQLGEQLLNSILVVQRRIGCEDEWVWLGEEEQCYMVKCGYIILNKEGIVERLEVFQQLWSLKVVPSTLMSVWTALLDKLLTKVILFKRGVQLGTYFYPLCKRVEETAQHLFINCVVVQEVWDACERWIGIMSVRHESILPHYYHFHLPMLTTKGNQLWKVLWVAIVTETWALRNKVVFRNGVVDNMKIFSVVQFRGWY